MKKQLKKTLMEELGLDPNYTDYAKIGKRAGYSGEYVKMILTGTRNGERSGARQRVINAARFIYRTAA